MNDKPRILITNDDGINAEGLLALKSALDPIGTVFVVAPDRPRSACGHAITLHEPLRMSAVRLSDGSEGYASSGTPTDCVALGILDLMESKVSLVVSGINWGPNLGWDLTYSGTVSGAMEGVVMGIPSIAASVATHAEDVTFDVAADFVAFLSRQVLERGLPPGIMLNVNVPNGPANHIQGVEITRQGRRRYAGRVEKRVDPMGRAYYWLGGDLPIDVMDEGTDVKAVADCRISVTPVHLDLTGYSALEQLRGWQVEEFKP